MKKSRPLRMKSLKKTTTSPRIVSGGNNYKRKGMTINGLPVVDAKRPLPLEITTADITHSNPMDPAGCAAAVAVMRQEGVRAALIHLTKAYIRRDLGGKPKYWERYEAPRRLRTEVVAFDRGGSFEPDEFELRPICPSQTIETRKARYRLQVPGGKNALPKKSEWKKYPNKGTPGARPRKAMVTKVRARPSKTS